MADQVGTVEIPVGNGSDEDITVETETRPEDAPFGYKADGTPYKRDPKRYQKRSARQRSASAPKTKGGAKKSPYREATLGLFQIVSLPLAAAATQNEVFAADLVAVSIHAEPIAEAVDSLAQSNEKVAKALDRLSEVGPYGLVIGAVAPLVLQLLTNHGLVPIGVAGTIDPAVLVGAPIDVGEAA